MFDPITPSCSYLLWAFCSPHCSWGHSGHGTSQAAPLARTNQCDRDYGRGHRAHHVHCGGAHVHGRGPPHHRAHDHGGGPPRECARVHGRGPPRQLRVGVGALPPRE